MTVWLVRAGGQGEYESKFIDEKKLFITWDGLAENLGALPSRDALLEALLRTYPDDGLSRRRNHASQLWPFAHVMQRGDWVVLPRKTDRTICIGEITGDYVFNAKAENPFYHSRSVKWLVQGVPRSHFGQDLLHTFGAFMTVCQIQRNNAEFRLQAMADNQWKPEKLSDVIAPEIDGVPAAEAADADLSDMGQDQIARLILARFKGHGLARLVEAILQAQGYHTHRSPEGADGGVDILAGSGALGFGDIRLCVQVKSHMDKAATVAEYNQLGGAMKTVSANQGLFVSWAGYTPQVHALARNAFFTVRLWTQRELFAALFEVYDKLPSDIRAELPLTRIWSVEPSKG
jgi:restriction system protein